MKKFIFFSLIFSLLQCYKPQMETDRLILRPFTLADAPDVFEFKRDAQVAQYLRGVKVHQEIKETINMLTNIIAWYDNEEGSSWIAVVDKKTKKVIGMAGYISYNKEKQEVEIAGYGAASFWGSSYGPEVGKALVDWAWKNLKVNRIVAKIDPDNTRSKSVVQKLGMKFVEKLEQVAKNIDGKMRDREVYELIRTQS